MEQKTKNSAQYLKTKVLTASQEQLQLMLYDGAIRFCEQARIAIEKKEVENSFNLLTKAENILMELTTSMKDEILPDVCSNMRRLYIFCYERLVEANVKKEIPPLDEALRILRHIRETWLQLMENLKLENARHNLSQSSLPQDLQSQEIGATINFEG